ncbi:MAG: hypothetical protein N4A76_12825 [Firmicutes bacterium]|nr:hypothetical protein [Bacillota bacterium]
MKSIKVSCTMCLILVIITLFTGLTYGQEKVGAVENTQKYYHYDMSLEDFHSLALKSWKIGGDIPRSTIDIGETITRYTIIDTSYYDETNTAAMMKSDYKVLDILEIGFNSAYVFYERQDEIVKVFTKDEFDSYKKNFSNNGVLFYITDANKSVFKKVFEEKGVLNSLNTKISPYRDFQKDSFLEYERFSKDKGYNAYKLSLGNVIADKYYVDIKTIKDTHPEFCEFLIKNADKYKYLNKTSIDKAIEYTSYFGDGYRPSSDFIGTDHYFTYHSKNTYGFSSKFKFDKFLESTGLKYKKEIKSFEGKLFKIRREIYFRKDGSIKKTESALIDVSDKSYNSDDLIKAVEEVVNNYGVRMVFSSNNLVFYPQENYDPNFYAQIDPNNYIVNKYSGYEHNSITPPKIYNANGSIVHAIGDNNIANATLDSMWEYQLSLLGISKTIKEPTTQANKLEFYDLHSGVYNSGLENIKLVVTSNHILQFFTRDSNLKMNMIDFNETYYKTGRIVDKANHIVHYAFSNDMLIDSYPWGLEIKDKINPNNNMIFYRVPYYYTTKVTSSIFTNPVQHSNQGDNWYWDLKDYYKGDISFVSVKNGVETVEKYKLLEGNENFEINSSKSIKHKARKVADNTIITIELNFEEDRIMISSY